MKHTPTPWRLAGIEIWAGSKRIAMGNGAYDEKDRETKKANAAFIVKAVNLHDELVEACRLFVSHHDGYNIDGSKRYLLDKDIENQCAQNWEKVCGIARDILAKAAGGE